MKILKGILLSLVILVGIGLIAALFVKSTYSVEREIIINRTEQDVFNYVKFLKNQNNYSKWATMDPAMKQNFKGIDGMAGFVSSWESNRKDVGKGAQTILKVTEGERIDYELHFIEPFEGKAQAHMTTELMTDTSTLVTWGFASKMKYPMNLMLLFMDMEDMVGNDLSTGLSNLKALLEK